MASRRGILKKGAIGGGLVFGGLVVIGGIASETDYIDGPADDETEPVSDSNSATTENGTGEDSQKEPTTVVQGEAHSREHWRFDMEVGEEIEVEVEVVERPEYGDEAHVDLETVAEGAVAEWTFPFSDVDRKFQYTAGVSAEHTLKVYGVGIAEVVVVLYGG